MPIHSGFNFPNLAKYFVPSSQDIPARRYDLDWLRVGVFAILIFYHTGMFYVENWGWHVKSLYRTEFLENIMLMVEPWRMPVLWIIAGIAIRFILVKVPVWRFVFMRSYRLLLPLLFGVLIVVPPQLYIEMTANNDLNMSYWLFLKAFFSSNGHIFNDYQAGIWPHIDVNHLWFIRSLWQFSLILVCLLPLLNARQVNSFVDWILKQRGFISLLLAILPVFLVQIFSPGGDERYVLGFIFMIYGYLIGWNKLFWHSINNNFKTLVIASVVCFICFIAFYHLVWLEITEETKLENKGRQLIGLFIYSVMRVLGALAMFGLAYKFFNKKSQLLNYCNNAVYPFYILHQTLIVVIGFNLSSLDLGPIVEPILLITLTFFGCFIGYELIRKVEWLRPFFGLKRTAHFHPAVEKTSFAVTSLMMLFIGAEIIF